MSLTIDQMHLNPVMDRCARELEHEFPGLITFTSGRRDDHQQAHAMAVNHVLDPKHYLMRQYVNASEFLCCLTEHPEATSIDEITELFYQLLVQTPLLVQSPHRSGGAVDLRPMEQPNGEPTEEGARVILWIRARRETTDFRTREGKLKRWHWACALTVDATVQV